MRVAINLLTEHPDSVLVAWIAGAGARSRTICPSAGPNETKETS